MQAVNYPIEAVHDADAVNIFPNKYNVVIFENNLFKSRH